MKSINFISTQRDGYAISTDPSQLQIDIIHEYLSKESYWAKDIPLNVVETSIRNSLCYGMYFQGQQIGFARLITDMATFAYLADVFVLESHRGKGLSKWLMETMHANPELQGLRRWVLGTRDAHGLYEQFGWTVFTEEARQRFMQLHKPTPYQSQ